MMRNKSGFALVEILVVVAITSALAGLVIPGTLQARMNANEVLAKRTVKAMSDAAEIYAINTGQYPNTFSDMVEEMPPYIDEDTCGKTISGYNYTCPDADNTATGYYYMAEPARPHQSGRYNYTITTGGNLVQEDASGS